MGRTPNSNVVDLTRGSRRKSGGKRKDSKPPAAKIVAGEPDRPAGLTEPETAIWNQIIPLLHERGVLSKLDGHMIAAYCGLVARYWDLKKTLQNDGYTQSRKTKTGTMVLAHPLWSMLTKTEDQIRSFATEFGLTPASRPKAPGQGDLFPPGQGSGWGEFGA